MAFPQTWDELFLIGITRAGGSEVQIAAMVDPTSLDLGEGEYPFESLPNAAGGRVGKQGPEEDGEISFDLIAPVELDATSAVGLFQQWIGTSGGGAYDSSEPLAGDTSWPAGVNKVRDRFRIAVLFTNDAAATTASGATAASTDGLRFYANDCRFTSHKASFSDGYLKVTVTFKYPPVNKAGTTRSANWESGDQTAIAALASFT